MSHPKQSEEASMIGLGLSVEQLTRYEELRNGYGNATPETARAFPDNGDMHKPVDRAAVARITSQLAMMQM